MKKEHPLRQGLLGFHLSHDRFWMIHTPEFSGVIAEYNDELTGYDPKLAELMPHVFHYGGNAYYILGTLCKERGWKVEEIDDR